MNSSLLIAASILSADFACLGQEVEQVLLAGADRIHIDVMDQHFVPNLTFGPLVCKALRRAGILAWFDVHLMVSPVEALITEFAAVGANSITIHPEATVHLDRALNQISHCGCRVGLALNPSTPIEFLDPVLHLLDQILVMTVNPGFGGQAMIPNAVSRVAQVRSRVQNTRRSIQIAVDGGVTQGNAAELAKAGADILVAGTAIFQTTDYQQAIASLRS